MAWVGYGKKVLDIFNNYYGWVMKIWTDEEVRSLNDYQKCGYWHPFTWGSAEGSVDLIATNEGWVCFPGGPVVQTWAHSFMLDRSWEHEPIFPTSSLFQKSK